MNLVDDRILEFLNETGSRQPAQIKRELKNTSEGMDYHEKYIGRRCRKLEEYNLIVNTGNGVYSITSSGKNYLAGDLDAAELEPSS